MNTNIYISHEHFLPGATANRAPRRPGAAAGAQAAWRGGPTEGDDRAGREHHEKRRAIKGSSKGFFTGRGVLSIRLSMCKERIWCAVWRSTISYISLQDAFDRSNSFDRSS